MLSFTNQHRLLKGCSLMKKFVINHPKNKSNKIFLVGCTRIGCVLSQSTYKKAYNIFVVQCISLRQIWGYFLYVDIRQIGDTSTYIFISPICFFYVSLSIWILSILTYKTFFHCNIIKYFGRQGKAKEVKYFLNRLAFFFIQNIKYKMTFNFYFLLRF